MKNFLFKVPILSYVALLMVSAIASPLVPESTAEGRHGGGEVPDAAVAAMLGAACPPDRVLLLAQVLRPPPDDPRSLAEHFQKRAAAGGGARFEADALTVDATLPGRKPFRVEGAHLVLEPSADGGSLRFELDGPLFGAASRVSAAGTIEWGKGPFGGDRLTLDFVIDDADLGVLRIAFPERFDAAFAGPLDLSGRGQGVVGEQSSEEAPATPFKGTLDGALDWVVLGRRDSLAFSSAFAIDDRNVRLSAGRLRSFGVEMDVSGWFEPGAEGQFQLNGAFAAIDVAKVEADWQVPSPWRATATASGKTQFWGRPGKSFLSYDVAAAEVSIPGIGGYSIRTGPVRFAGRLLAINGDVSGSVMPTALEVGPIRLDGLPVGITWWRDELTVTAANSTLWGGSVQTTFSYRPADYPRFGVNGLLENMRAKEFLSKTLPAYGLDIDGVIDVAYRVGRDAEAKPYFAARASLSAARLGPGNVFKQALAELASMPIRLSAPAADAALKESQTGSGAAFDKLFVEIEKKGDGFAIGGIFGRSGSLQLDGSGTMDGDGALDLHVSLYLPEAICDALIAGAPWAAPLRAEDGGLFVPLRIGGKASDMKATLEEAFVAAVAKARAGGPVTPFGLAKIEHVATSELATLSGDPGANSNP